MVFAKLKTEFLKRKLLLQELKQDKLEKLAKGRAKELELQTELIRRIKAAKGLRLTPKERAILEAKRKERAKKIALLTKEAKFVSGQLFKAAKIITKTISNEQMKEKQLKVKMKSNMKKLKSKPKKKKSNKKPTKTIFTRPKPKKKSK